VHSKPQVLGERQDEPLNLKTNLLKKAKKNYKIGEKGLNFLGGARVYRGYAAIENASTHHVFS
jgi:hypothetical protein